MKVLFPLAVLALLHGAALPAQAPVPITLRDAITRGRSSGVQASLAALGVRGVALRGRELQAGNLPDVSVSATASRQTVNLHEFGLSFPGLPGVTDPFTLFRGRVSVNQRILDLAANERLRINRDTAIAAGLDADRVGDITAATAAATWLRLASAQETVIARQQDSVTAFALLDIARAQVDAGTAPRIDRTRSETQAAATRTALALARNEQGRAQLALARAIDLPPASTVVAQGEPALADSATTDVAAALALARAQRPDLAAEVQRAKLLQQGLLSIRHEVLPTINASGFAQTSGTAVGELAGTWSVGVGLAWPLFDGFRRARRIDEQNIRIETQNVRIHDIESQIESDVRLAVLDLGSAREQVALAAERVRLAEQELSEARERFAAGVTGSVETTNAQAEVATARDVLIQARLALGAAEVSMARAIGVRR